MNPGVVSYLFLKLNVWLCVSSILMLVASALALALPLSAIGVGVLLPPLLFYFIYVEDRRTISPEDRFNEPLRTRLVEQHQRTLLYTEIIALAGYELILLAHVLPEPSLRIPGVLLGQLPLVVLVFYDYFKRVPTFDSIAVAATWAYVIVYTIVITTSHPLDPSLGTIFLGWFLIAFAGVESRNATDHIGDSLAEKPTLASYLGPHRTTILETSLKATGVLLFYQLAGPLVAALVLAYLVLLWTCRHLTARITRPVTYPHTPSSERATD